MKTRIKAMLTSRERQSYAGNLLELWMEIWHYCHLRCSYCFNDAGVRKTYHDLLDEFTYLSVLWEFKLMGGKVIGIPGFGEPFHPANLDLTMGLIKRALELDIRSYVFTTADLIDERLAKELLGLDVSLMVKINSVKSEVQDELVCSPGYTERRSKALLTLIELGFNKLEFDSEGSATTRLGLVTSIMPQNYTEIPNLFRFCRKNNIYPDIDTLLHLGRSYAQQETDPQDSLARNTFLELQRIDREEFCNESEISSAYAGESCNRYAYHMYMDMHGNVSPCLGANKKGAVLSNATDDSAALRTAWDSPLMRKVRERDYSGQCTKCSNFQSRRCTSCLGRFANICGDEISTTGCWCFKGN